ncbi:MAG: PEGA domain-containing protein [Bacteroidales bacterium]|nr:PEGA domain-containing protein [Bacteroidales bacterium]
MLRNFILLAITLLLIPTALSAGEFKVLNFYKAPNDIAAIRYERTDINGEECALIKVRTGLSGVTILPNAGAVGDVSYKEGDYWVYVSPGEQQLKFVKEGFIAKTFSFPMPIESSTVYVLELTGTGDKQALDEDLIKTTFRFNVSQVYISRGGVAPVQSTGTVAEFQLPKGNYSFTYSKEGYSEVNRNITVEEERVIDIRLQEGQEQTTMKLPGIITITSEPAGADVLLNNQKVGVTPYTDQIIAGVYDLTLKKNLYHTYSATFSLAEGDTKELPRIKLTPRFGYIAVNSEPSGAEIFLDGKSLGTAPIPRQKIESGNHTLRAEMDLYHSETLEFTIADGDDISPKLTLDPAFGSLTVNSEPSGARVYLDDEMIGTTPHTENRLASGNYELRVTKDLWNEVTERLTINNEQTTEKMIVLTQDFGTVEVNAPGATIYQNNERVGTGQYKAKLQPGRYMFKATRDKHLDDEEEIYLSVGDTRTLNLNPQPIQGSVSIFSEPRKTRGAEIYVNNQEQKKTTPAVLPLLIGDYTITLKKDGFLDNTRAITVKANEQKKLTFQMQTYKGSLQQTFNKHKREKLVWGAAAILSAGAGAYFQQSADKHYDEYQDTNVTQDAIDLREQVDKEDQLSLIGYGVGAACLVPAIIHAVKQGKVKNKLDITAKPYGDGLVLGVNFKL